MYARSETVLYRRGAFSGGMGDEGNDAMYVLKSGQVVLEAEGDGHEKKRIYINIGGYFGELNYFGLVPHRLAT